MSKALIAVCAAILLVDVASASTKTYFTENIEEVKAHFDLFKKKFNKSYKSTEEETQRLEIFKQNLKLIDENNIKEIEMTKNFSKDFERAVHGITRFADLTKDEFKKILGTKPLTKEQLSSVDRRKPDDKEGRKLSFIFDSTKTVDWTDSLVTPVKDQGYCGSCWAFASAEQAESDAIRILNRNKDTYILSPGQIAQCTVSSYGCNGGFFQSGLQYLSQAGAMYSADYPYLSYYGNTGLCLADANQAVPDRINYVSTIIGQEEITSHVFQTGPVAAVVNADNWSTYESGIMVAGCDLTGNINHAIQIVAVHPDEPENGGFWKIRNSWSADWGEEGFIRIAYNMNACLVDTYASFTSYNV